MAKKDSYSEAKNMLTLCDLGSRDAERTMQVGEYNRWSKQRTTLKHLKVCYMSYV